MNKFWGKYLIDESGEARILPPAGHCVDVAIVFRRLAGLPGVRRNLESLAGRALDDMDLDRLAVIVYFHDVGKVNLGFQNKVFDASAPKIGHIQEMAPLFEGELLERFAASMDVRSMSWGDEEVMNGLFVASWSHHGRPVMFSDSGEKTREARRWWKSDGSRDPFEQIALLADWAKRIFPGAFMDGGKPLPDSPEFCHHFAGLVALADWLGSHAGYFPVEDVDIADRAARDQSMAGEILKNTGLDPEDLRKFLSGMGLDSFEARFGGFRPRPLQAAVHDLPVGDPGSRLVIAESETGSGKTEAALTRFLSLFAAGEVDGLYFALPTRVAARGLYDRVVGIVQKWFPDPGARPVTLLAVPGYTQVDGVPADSLLPDETQGRRWKDDSDSRDAARERLWAAERPKRFLAATIAIGTIDQALMSIIQVPHAHLRSACLGRSFLVVDEVHASDAYMSALLKRLLDRHLSRGGQAMLLSATLGSRARAEFLGIPQPAFDDAVADPYPSISTTGESKPRACGAGGTNNKDVLFELSPCASSPEKIAPQIVSALEDGARVLVIMNTVSRANQLLRKVEDLVDRDWLFQCNGVVCLHHGRFSPEDRLLLDRAVVDRMGKGSATGPLLVIGTQTLEQSLDIDADLLITDLCPADVLLQRVGRLHRHDRSRPGNMGQARCIVLVPDSDMEFALDSKGNVSGPFKKMGFGSVYDDMRALELTKRFLLDNPRVQIPADNRRLVEEITHPDSLRRLTGSRWKAHAGKIEGASLADEVAACTVVVPLDKRFGEFSFCDNAANVLTRLGASSYCFSLKPAPVSPFGRTLKSMVIPGHLIPGDAERLDETADVGEGRDEDGFAFSLKDKDLRVRARYRYSRFGIERLP